jgi:alpha-ketoglutarate-dependent taurine dioxygenase
MKFTLHENGWTVLVHDFDFKKTTKDEIDIIGCLLSSNTCVVFRNQDLTVEQEVEIISKFGNVERAVDEYEGISEDQKLQNKNIIEQYHVPGSNNTLIRVTGEKNHKGEVGLFGEVHELDWHANKVEHATRKPLVWLRAVRGSAGSKTSWTNHILAYQNLPAAIKKTCHNLKVDYHYHQEYPDVHKLSPVIKDNFGLPDFYPPLVYTNEGGHQGLYFSWRQVSSLIGAGMDSKASKKLIYVLMNHILGNPKHIYNHDWHDGDIVISEQWMGAHKRWACDTLDSRVLHRATMDFAFIDFKKTKLAQSMLTN